MNSTSNNSQTARPIRGTIVRMSKTAIAALVLVGSGLTFAGVQAAQPPATCKVVSTATRTETQAGPNHTVRTREITVTKQRCRGEVVTRTTATAWR